MSTTDTTLLTFADNHEYGDAIGEIAMLSQGSQDSARLVALVGAALRYAAATSRAAALREAAEFLADPVPPVTAGPRTEFESGVMHAVRYLDRKAKDSAPGPRP